MVVGNKRVLVVDDEEIVCESCKRVLTGEGYSVRTARTGRDAIEACRAKPFDVVFTDLKMPDMDGLEVTRTVREEHPKSQVVVITGYPSEQSTIEAQRLGVFDYLHKPLTPERLSAAMAAALASPARPMPMLTPIPSAAPVPDETPFFEPQSDALDGPDAVPAAAPESAWKTCAFLAAAPLIGLAYILLLPLIGFGMLLAVIGSAVTTKLGSARI